MVDQLSVITQQSEGLIEILRSHPLDTQVPSTPGWSLSDLGFHMARVQQWATSIVENGVAPSHELSPLADNAADALEASHQALIPVLRAADPDASCWNFTSTAPHVASFWFRRQSNEVSIHRWDAEAAISQAPPAINAEVAVQIIDEFVHVMMARVIDREGLDLSGLTSDVHVHCTDAPGEWTFEMINGELVVVDEHRKSTVALRGPASNLALYLLNRTGEDHVEVFGDTDELARWSQAFRH